MRIVVVGATGNVGTSLVRVLAADERVERIVGIARRRPELEVPKTEWVAADVERDGLDRLIGGADAVVHLAWRIQPSRDLNALWRTNVEGSTRVFTAVARAGVPALVYGSSVGVNSPGPKDRRVDESWPREGVATSYYGLHKAEVERRLDRLELDAPDLRVVRLRPALIFKRESASEQRRYFAGPFLPTPLLRRGSVPFFPDTPGLSFQAVHTEDVAHAYCLAIMGRVRGAFNIAAEPVLDPPLLAGLAGARLVPVPATLLRAVVAATWRLHLQPTRSGWVDMALDVPLMDTARARTSLGWQPRHGADDALRELARGMRERAGAPTPPLAAGAGGAFRLGEIATGIGKRERP